MQRLGLGHDLGATSWSNGHNHSACPHPFVSLLLALTITLIEREALERGYWQAKAGSSSRNRVYPDSHPGISGVIGTRPGLTPDVRVTLTLVGVPAVQWLRPLAGSVLTLTWASRVIQDLTHQGPEDLSPELLFSFRSWGRPHPQLCLVGRGPQQVRGLPAAPPPALPLPAAAAAEAFTEPGRELPEPGRRSRGPCRS